MDKKAKARKLNKPRMSSAAGQLFRMLGRNNGSELMLPEDNECNDTLTAAAHELSKELNIKELLLKANMPDLGTDDLGLFPSCANSDLPWIRPKYKNKKLDVASQEWQYEPKDSDDVEFLGEEKKKKENLSLMDIWVDSEDHAELVRLNDMLSPEIEIVWEGKAKQGLTDDKSEKQTGHDVNHVIVEKQGKRVEIKNKGSGCRGQRSDKRALSNMPQTRRSSRNLRSNLRFLPCLSVTPSVKRNKH